MFGEKLISLIGGLSKFELNRLRKFLRSPFFNEQEDVLALFEYLNSLLRSENNRLHALEYAHIWQAVYGNSDFDEQQLRRLTSELTSLTLRFMAVQQWLQQSYSEDLALQTLLTRPELSKHLAGVERRLNRTMEERAGELDAGDYWARYQMHWNAFTRDTGVLSTTGLDEKLSRVDYALDCYYAIQKLKFYVADLLYRRARAALKSMPPAEGLWSFVNDPRFASETLLVLYRQAAEALKAFDQEHHYKTFVEHLQTAGRNIATSEQRELNQLAQNYCALKINEGNTAYYRELFLLHKYSIEHGLLLTGNTLSEGLYKNIITVSLRVGEYAWAERFIESYAEKLPAHIRENARTFNLANLFSHQRRHDKVIELLRNVEYSDIVYALSAKLILVRTYYESGEFNALDSLIDSFRIFLRRNKLISKSVKDQYSQFLRFVGRLLALRPGDHEALELLRQQIAACEPLMSKQWLLEKVYENKP